MLTASRPGAALLLLLLLCGPGAAHADGTQLADLEGGLLHRRLDLSGVKRWDRRTQTWTPFRVPPKSRTRLYVVNVWSVHCKPCLKEFPLLKRIAKAWLPDPRVGFLFVADPPTENSESEFSSFWTHAADEVPDVDPLRSDGPLLQKALDLDSRPLTLLVDKNLVVRQSFVGNIEARNLGSAIERLLRAVARDK